jgi:hypothetical protein
MHTKRAGDTWKKFFEMDTVIPLARSKEELKQADRELLEKVLARFDSVSQDSKYGTVKEMRGFDEAHATLKTLIEGSKNAENMTAPTSTESETEPENEGN